MTRKDYEAFASVIRDFLDEYGYDQHNRMVAGWFFSALSKVFIKDNPRFDEVKFRRACGFDRDWVK